MRCHRFSVLVWMSVLLQVLLAGCSSFLSTGPGANRDFLKDPFLSPAQKALLVELRARSATPLQVKVWQRAGTIEGLELAVPSGIDVNAPPVEHALAFVNHHARLWRLDPLPKFTARLGGMTDSCSSVVLEPVTPGGAVIFNAGLVVGVTKDGIVRRVAGRMTGQIILPPPAPTKVDVREASRILLAHLGEPRLVLPAPREAILDPAFLGDGPHRPAKAWMFSGSSTESKVGPFLVDQTNGAVVGVTRHWDVSDSAGCWKSNPAVPPEVVLDPLTNTPAYVGFRHFGGLATVGAVPVDRAYSVLERETIARMYGTLVPREHLKDAVVAPGTAGGWRVRFNEYYRGVPVEGAHLAVTLAANGDAENILSRFVYYPRVETMPTLPSPDAERAAFQKFLDLHCQGGTAERSGCQKVLAAARQNSAPKSSLVILSSRIFEGTTMPVQTERLAWKFEYPGRIIYWHAHRPGEFLFDLRTTLSHIVFRVNNIEQGGRTEVANDGTAVSGITPHADAVAVAGFVGTLDAFYANLGRHSFDDAEGLLVAHVRWSTKNAVFCTTADSTIPCATNEMAIGSGFAVGDVFAHEFTHGVTETSARLVYAGESGALNESYSDVIGNLAFPDSTATEWFVGEGTSDGAVRDMKNPSAFGQPGHVGLMNQSCLSDSDKCVHLWSSIPNLTAVHIADGGIPGDPHAGIGRAKLARLYFNTLTGGPSSSTSRLGTSDRFLNQRVVTAAVCRELVAASPLPDGLTFVPADCDHVGHAFDAVGVNAAPTYGWSKFSTSLSGTTYDVSLYSGQSLMQGCTLKQLTLRAIDKDGTSKTSNIDDGLSIDMGGWGVRMTDPSAGSARGRTQRSMTYHLWAEWFESGVVADPVEEFNVPAGLTHDDCLRPAPATHWRALYSTTRVSHWATFFNGGRDDQMVNQSATMPAGCEVREVLALEDHKGEAQSPPKATDDHGDHGYTVSKDSGDSRSLGVKAHWWHTGVSSIAYRVLYNVVENDGVDCSVAGSTQDTP